MHSLTGLAMTAVYELGLPSDGARLCIILKISTILVRFGWT